LKYIVNSVFYNRYLLAPFLAEESTALCIWVALVVDVAHCVTWLATDTMLWVHCRWKSVFCSFLTSLELYNHEIKIGLGLKLIVLL
jgi:hypothetical protein